jgi:hypothetical protein
VSGQLHALTTFLLTEELLVSIGEGFEWALELSGIVNNRKICCLCWELNPNSSKYMNKSTISFRFCSGPVTSSDFVMFSFL